jgi:hypothetical protein
VSTPRRLVELIPLAVRIAVRNAVGGWGPFTVGGIHDLFESHEFTERDESVAAAGERRTAAEQFQARIDFESPDQARRYLDLISDVLDFYPADASEPGDSGRVLRRALSRAGLVGADGRLRLPEDRAGQPADADVDIEGIWAPERVRVFFSHVHAVRADVTEIARWLESMNCSCFVAHVQIEPARDWQEVIENGLRTCHVLVAYVTEDFPKSPWTEQEVGWALGREIPIIPVNAGLQPYGFFGSYQSLQANPQQPASVALAIFQAIAVACFRGQRPAGAAVAPLVARSIVRAFCQSGSYESTRQRFPLLELVPPNRLTNDLMTELERAMMENSQIREGVLRGRPGRPVPEAIRELIARARARE